MILVQPNTGTPQAMEWTSGGDPNLVPTIAGGHSLAAATSFIVSDATTGDGLTSITLRLPALTSFQLSQNPVVCTFSLNSCTALTSIDVSDNTAQTSYSFTNFSALQSFVGNGCTEVTSITLTGCPVLNQVTATGCTNLVAANLTYTLLTVVNFNLCALPLSYVDAILIGLDGNGISGGSVNLAGGTNAVPGASGQTAAANLIGKGWTVTVNS